MLAMPRPVQLPHRFGLPDVNATLQNGELWQQFHEIGTEMIITKSGRWVLTRFFMQLLIAHYVTSLEFLLEMSIVHKQMNEMEKKC